MKNTLRRGINVNYADEDESTSQSFNSAVQFKVAVDNGRIKFLDRKVLFEFLNR
jgi:hypothetical protein